MTSNTILTTEERENLIELILQDRAKQKPDAGSGYFAAAKKGLQQETDEMLIKKATRIGFVVKPASVVTAPKRVSRYTLGQSVTFKDGRTGTVVEITEHTTILEMDDRHILAIPH